jgi:secreted trypsin-like serine protease
MLVRKTTEPLALHDQSGKTELEGIVSSEEGFAQKGFPGVYARVKEYVKWINQQPNFIIRR